MNSPMINWLKDPFGIRMEVVGRTEIKGCLVDTCFTSDNGEYETYVRTPKGSAVVKHYGKDFKKAKKGHNYWVEFVKQNPDFKPKEERDIMEWVLGKDGK